MLLYPHNNCQPLCQNLKLNVDDSIPTKYFTCKICGEGVFSIHFEVMCCKKYMVQVENVHHRGFGGNDDVFVKKEPLYLIFYDLKVLQSFPGNTLQQLQQLGYRNINQLIEMHVTVGLKEMLNLLKYTLTSHEPLTNTILKSCSKNKDSPPNQFTSAVRVKTSTRKIKVDVKLVRSKSQKKIIFAEASENFVDFMFSFLTIPLGSIVKVLDGNSFVGCVDNLYKSVENLDSSWCTDSRSVLLNPGVIPQFGCPNQPLNIPHVKTPATTYYYGTGKQEKDFRYPNRYSTIEVPVVGGVISKTVGSIYNAKALTEMDPRSPSKSIKDVVGFVKRPALYVVGDDLKLKPLSANSWLSYLKELSFPLDDLEVKVISIGEAEALSLLAASLTSKSTLTSGLEEFFNMSKQDSNLTSKCVQTSRLDKVAKKPKLVH